MAKKVIHFTQARIKALPSPDAGRVEYYDDEEKRLMCRVSSTGNKTYSVVKWVNGKVQRVTIGNVDDYPVDKARKKAKDILSDLNAGINPTEQKRKQKVEKTNQIKSSKTLQELDREKLESKFSKDKKETLN